MLTLNEVEEVLDVVDVEELLPGGSLAVRLLERSWFLRKECQLVGNMQATP